MLQKLTLRSAKYAIVSGLSQVECRTSTTRGYSMNCRSKVSRYSRLSAVFLNETGNWISSAPNLPVAAIASSPWRAKRSSSSLGRMETADVGSIAARGECVNERCNFAAKRSEEHTSELQSLAYLVCRLLL